MAHKFTDADKKIVRFFLLNGNKPSYQAQIERGSGVSAKWLGKLNDNPGRLAILRHAGVLVSKTRRAPKGVTDYFSLSDDYLVIGSEKNEQILGFLSDEEKRAYQPSRLIITLDATPEGVREVMELLFSRRKWLQELNYEERELIEFELEKQLLECGIDKVVAWLDAQQAQSSPS
jgi:hypothetical protein